VVVEVVSTKIDEFPVCFRYVVCFGGLWLVLGR